MPFDGAFSPLHWLIVAVVALLVLGPDQLPKLAKQAGRAYNDFSRMKTHLRTELRDLVSEFDLAGEDSAANLPPAPPDHIGTHSEPTTEEST